MITNGDSSISKRSVEVASSECETPLQPAKGALDNPNCNVKSLAQKALWKVVALNAVVIVVTILVATPSDTVSRQFDEGGIITYFSVIQLLMLSWFSDKIFKTRRQGIKHPWQSSVAIWGIFSFGFFFLALDDLIMIHEWFDKMIHAVGQFEETGWSDRIDDLIVALYGLMAIGLLVVYRRELKKFRLAFPYTVVGFLLLFLMVGVDAITNRNDILPIIFSEEVVDVLLDWDLIVEEALKLMSEAVLIVAAYLCHCRAKQLNYRKAAENALEPITARNTEL